MNDTRKEALPFLIGYLILTSIFAIIFYLGPYWIPYLKEADILYESIDSAIIGVFTIWVFASVFALIKLIDFIKGYK